MEKAMQPLFRQIRDLGIRIESVTRGGNRALVQIRGEDLHAWSVRDRRGMFRQDYCHGIRFFTRRASCDPRSHFIGALLAMEETWDDFGFQRVVDLRITKEVRDADQQ